MQESPKKSILLFREKTKPSSKVKTIPNERRAKEIEKTNYIWGLAKLQNMFGMTFTSSNKNLINKKIGGSISVSYFIYFRL